MTEIMVAGIPNIPEGTPVKLTIIGTLSKDTGNGFYVVTRDIDGQNSHHYISEKVLHHLEPWEKYQDGCAYADVTGQIYIYGAARYWLVPGSGGAKDFDVPKRPLRKLVPEE